MAPTASTLYKQQSRYKGKLTREYASTGLGTIYWSSTQTLGITAGWFQVDPDNTKGEELFITGITGTTAEYSGTVSIRGLRDYGADTNVPAKQYVHRSTAKIIVSDNHSWTDQMITAFLAHEQLAGAFHGFAGIGTDAARPAAAAGNTGMIYWSTDGLIMYYSNGSAWTAQSAGAQPDSSSTVKGVSKLSVAASNTANPIVVGDNDPRVVTGNTTQRGVFIEAVAADIIAGTQTHSSGVEFTVNPKYLADASTSASAGVADANKYLRLNSSGSIDQSNTGISVNAGNDGAQGDLLEITGSNIATSLKRKIVATNPIQATLTNAGTPDTNGAEYNNHGKKAVFTSSTGFFSLYPGDNAVRYAYWSYNAFFKRWDLGTMGSISSSDGSYTNSRILSTNNGLTIFYPSGSTLCANNITVATGVNNPACFGACNISSQYSLLFYCKGGTGFEAVVVVHDGTSTLNNISVGAVATISSHINTPGNFTAVQIGVNKVLLVYPNSAQTQLMGMVVTISGTSISTNTPQTIATYNTTYSGAEDGVRFGYSFYQEQGIADKAIISFHNLVAVQSVVIDVTGTTFTVTSMTGVPNTNVYSLLSKDVILIGASLSAMKGYYIDSTNNKYTEITETCAIPDVSSLMSVLYSSSKCVSIGQAASTRSIQDISAQHPAPLISVSSYTNGNTVKVTNKGEVTVPTLTGSSGDIQYLTFSGVSNTKINDATAIGVTKNSTTIILS